MRRNAGFTLIEVLVAVLVLAIGLIGGAAMQLHAMRARHESALATAAMQAATGMAERIRANASQAAVYLALDYDAALEPSAIAPPSLCLAMPCTPAEAAALDVHEMKQLVGAYLPAGRVRVCRDAHAWHEGRLRWECGGEPAAPVVIKIGWRGRNPGGTLGTRTQDGFVPAVAVTVAGVAP